MATERKFLALLTNTNVDGTVNMQIAATSDIQDAVYSHDDYYGYITKEGAFALHPDENGIPQTTIHCHITPQGGSDDRVQQKIVRYNDDQILISNWQMDGTEVLPYFNKTSVLIIISSSLSA